MAHDLTRVNVELGCGEARQPQCSSLLLCHGRADLPSPRPNTAPPPIRQQARAPRSVGTGGRCESDPQVQARCCALFWGVRCAHAGARGSAPAGGGLASHATPPSHEAEASLPPSASAGAEANTRPGRPSCSSPRSTSGLPTRVSGALGLPTLQAQERRPGSAAAFGGATRGDAPGPARHQDHRAT